ncbi:PAP1 domain-containing protein [Trichoderma ceciliae]
MATTGSGSGSSLPPNFFLTPQQQNLLFTALNANKQQQANAKTGLSLSPTSFKSAPLQSLDGAGFQESPFLDNYDYDFGDSSFDFSFASDAAQGNMIGDVPDSAMSAKSDSTETDSPEKRSHPDDEDDDASPGNESKRHESSDKIPKKPGRKPLTSEPTSKRKAQNRAAQRAFRERKEKHLKDLETKVEELEKASEAANHENGMLRAQVERITAELNHYKQRMTLTAPKASTQTRAQPFSNAAVNNLNDVSFQFEFPKFGTLPGPPAKTHQKSMSQPISPSSNQSSSPTASQKNVEKVSQLSQQAARNAQFKEDLAKFNNGVFNMHTPSMSSSTATGSRASVDSANYSLNNTTSSPSASSHSHVGATSSCGTSPEPFTQSPMGFKPVDTLTTIGEEHPSMSTTGGPFAQFNSLDFSNNSFDWLVQQNNGGQFDPQLFGDYREPQENVMTHSTFDDLFNDSVEADFFTPYNVGASPNQPKKTNLIDEIDAKQNAIDDEPSTSKQNMSCNQLWERLQACPKAQNGEFDLDGLCSELTKKAKCSGSGPVVAERDFDSILKKYMGKEAAECTAEKLGISLDKVKPESLVMP